MSNVVKMAAGGRVRAVAMALTKGVLRKVEVEFRQAEA